MLLVIPSLSVYPSSLILPIRSIMHLKNFITDAHIVQTFILPIPGQGAPDAVYTRNQLINSINTILPSLKESQTNIAKSLILTHPKPLLDILRSDKLYLVGHDLGGVIAQEYAMKYPTSVAALCTIGVGTRFNSFAFGIWKRLVVDNWILGSKLTRSIAKIGVWNFRHKQLISLLDEYPHHKGFNSGAQILANYNWNNSLTKKTRVAQVAYLSIPQLIIGGTNDVYTLPSNIRYLYKSLNKQSDALKIESQVRTHFHNKGHDLFSDIVDFTTILREFLTQS